MQIEVEAFSGEASPARKALAARIAAESFGWLADVVRGVVMRVPEGRGAGASCTSSVVVVLRDGRRFDALATEESVADSLERACHDLRREIAAELGRPLRRRRATDASRDEVVSRVDRRASGTE
jgi:hypothetical protein